MQADAESVLPEQRPCLHERPRHGRLGLAMVFAQVRCDQSIEGAKQALAEMIGTTQSRVGYFMNRFRELGYIDYNGGILVNKTLRNVVLHDEFVDPEKAFFRRHVRPLASR